MGHAVDIYERWPDVGGQASAFDLGNGVFLERYYHHLFESDVEMTALHEELLPGQLEWHESSVAMYANERFWPFTTPLDLLRYGELGPLERARLGAAVLRLVRMRPTAKHEGTSALAWLRRWCGDRTVERVWAPLMFGKFGDEAPQVPLTWLRSKLVLRRQRLAGRGAARERLGYPRGSFRAIAVALAEDIRRRGGTVALDREVVAIEPTADGLRLRCAPAGAYRAPLGAARADAGRDATADLALITTGTSVTRRLVAWPAAFTRALDAWRYRTAVVLLLELAEPFGRIYWTNVVDPDAPFLALIEHTNLVPAERYPARYLYVSNYVAQDDPLVALSTDELVARYMPTLARMHPRFDRGRIQRAWSFREEFAQPVPTLKTREQLMPFGTPVANVFVANTTQIYPEDRGTNYSVRLGRDAARAIAGA